MLRSFIAKFVPQTMAEVERRFPRSKSDKPACQLRQFARRCFPGNRKDAFPARKDTCVGQSRAGMFSLNIGHTFAGKAFLEFQPFKRLDYKLFKTAFRKYSKINKLYRNRVQHKPPQLYPGV